MLKISTDDPGAKLKERCLFLAFIVFIRKIKYFKMLSRDKTDNDVL